jgi:hypothetical protein
MSNLKPFAGADDKRRQNGRKKGSKNISTIVREILDSDINPKLNLNNQITELVGTNSPLTYARAMSLAIIIKAIGGDVRAADWVMNQYDKSPDPEGFFNKTEIVFSIVPDRTDLEHEES